MMTVAIEGYANPVVHRYVHDTGFTACGRNSANMNHMPRLPDLVEKFCRACYPVEPDGSRHGG